MEDEIGTGLRVLDRRTRILRICLILAFAGSILEGLFELGIYLGFLDPEYGSNPEILAYALSALFTFVTLIVAIVFFSMWIHRAVSNVVRQDVDGFEYTPGWAVGWYFIPFANLFKPFQAMRQTWNASHGATGYHLNDGNPLITGWWAAWLVTSILSNVAFRLSLKNDIVELGQLDSLLTVVSAVVDIALYPLAIRMVTSINRAQQNYFTRNMFA